MVQIKDIEAGIVRYIDAEMAPKIPVNVPNGQIRKIAAVAGAVYAVHNKLQQAASAPILATIGAVDGEGNVDLKGLANAVKQQIQEDGVKVTVPILGELTFFREDIDRLLQYVEGGNKG